LAVLLAKVRTWKRVLLADGLGAAWSLFIGRIQRLSRTIPGGLIRLGPCLFRSDAQSRELLLEGVYEEKERFATKHYIRPDIPVVEFGGSLGVVSCLLNRRLRTPSRHVVVEANPQNLPMLTGNRNRNSCKFEILHGAAGVVGKTVRLYFGNGALTASSIAATDNSVEVSGVTLEGVIRDRGFDSCALVCDIEGSEIHLIRSEIATFRSRVEVFIVEFHPIINGPVAVEDAQRFLEANGFEELWQRGDVYVFRNTARIQPNAGVR
jgi:FkbM family methyltransferase